MGIPSDVPASLVLFSSRNGCTKLNEIRFTEGEPSPRSINQRLRVLKSVMLRTVDQVQKSLPQCQAPYIVTPVKAATGFGFTGTPIKSEANTRRLSTNILSIPLFLRSWIEGRCLKACR